MNKYTCYYVPLLKEKIKLLEVEFHGEEVYFSSDNLIDKSNELFKDNDIERKILLDIACEITSFMDATMRRYKFEEYTEQTINMLKVEIDFFMKTLKEQYQFIEIK